MDERTTDREALADAQQAGVDAVEAMRPPRIVPCPECHGEVTLRLCNGHMIAGARPGRDRCPQCWCWRCGTDGEVEG